MSHHSKRVASADLAFYAAAMKMPCSPMIEEMRTPRIYHPSPLAAASEIALTEQAATHVRRVLRMKEGQRLLLFDGSNQIFNADIVLLNKKMLRVRLAECRNEDRESPLTLHLGQVISRSEKMAFSIQKSVELGVTTITPLFSERCGVQLSDERLLKKIQQWQQIAIAACEQCGRNRIPEIRMAIPVPDWCAEQDNDLKLTLHPHARNSLYTLPESCHRARLLIGPEGGLSDNEIALASGCGFTDISLGPRTLRTETTALCAITALQLRFGDLG